MNELAKESQIDEVVSSDSSPGASNLWATDTGGSKGWATAASVVGGVAPNSQQFNVAASTWTWTHGLGFRPLIEAYDSSWSKMLADIQHTSVNTVVATHSYNATGYLVAR